jgi:predicted kinase
MMAASRKVVLAVGLPGSGKSTYFARRGIRPLSSDLIREILYDDASDQRHPEWVFGALRELLRRRLLAGASVSYIDATNLTRRARRPFLDLAREFGCSAEALYFDVPLEVCLERNRNRGSAASGQGSSRLARAPKTDRRIVPEPVLRRMAGEIQRPTRKEGFARIRVLRPGVEKSHGRAGED